MKLIHIPAGPFLYGDENEPRHLPDFWISRTPVGQFSPGGDSYYGCADMAGNVHEWIGSVEGKYRILRGGAYNHGRDLAHSAFRIRHKPSYRYSNIGFRVGNFRD